MSWIVRCARPLLWLAPHIPWTKPCAPMQRLFKPPAHGVLIRPFPTESAEPMPMDCRRLNLEDQSTLFTKRADAFLVILTVEALIQHFVDHRQHWLATVGQALRTATRHSAPAH